MKKNDTRVAISEWPGPSLVRSPEAAIFIGSDGHAGHPVSFQRRGDSGDVRFSHLLYVFDSLSPIVNRLIGHFPLTMVRTRRLRKAAWPAADCFRPATLRMHGGWTGGPGRASTAGLFTG